MKALRKSRPLMILAALVLALSMSVPASAANTEELLAPADGQAYNVGDEVTVVVNPGLYKYFYAHGSALDADNFIYIRVTRDGERVCYERLGYKSVQNLSMSFTPEQPGTYLIEIERDVNPYTVSGTTIYTRTISYEEFSPSSYARAEITVNPKSIADAAVTGIPDSFPYDGSAKEPVPTVQYGTDTLEKDRDYTVSYKSNTNAGTAVVTVAGMGDYVGEKQIAFQIKPVSLSKATASAIKNQTYTGKALKPAVTLTYDGKTLKSGTDYTLTYKANKNAGTATVTVTGKGNFTGTRKLTFKINKAANPMTVKGKTAAVKYSAVKKKAQTVAAKNAFAVSKAQGKVTYKKTGGNKNITVSSAGKLTVKKGLKKGSYPVKVKVTAAGSGNYKSASKTATATVKVK